MTVLASDNGRNFVSASLSSHIWTVLLTLNLLSIYFQHLSISLLLFVVVLSCLFVTFILFDIQACIQVSISDMVLSCSDTVLFFSGHVITVVEPVATYSRVTPLQLPVSGSTAPAAQQHRDTHSDSIPNPVVNQCPKSVTSTSIGTTGALRLFRCSRALLQ